MKSVSEMYTVQEINERISEIGRHMPGLEQKALGGATPAERAANHKLDAMCEALERLVELKKEIASGFRDKDGTLNVRV